MESLPGKKLVSVCIATYRRAPLLEKLLTSIQAQSVPENLSLEAVVVDNDSGGSAERVVQRFSDVGGMSFKYFVQPVKNISITRNTCLKHAAGDFICFIDDDETASRDWVGQLYNALIKYDADGVFGYVEPVFDESIADHFKRREFYFSPLLDTGSESRFWFTTNCMVKAETIKICETPFNPKYGLTGGEDSHLFDRLVRKGARFVDCREAVSFEFIPANRGTKRYLFNRALRGGQSAARRQIEQNRTFAFKRRVFSRALTNIFYSSVFYILKFHCSRTRIQKIQLMGSSIGKMRAVFSRYKLLY